MTLGLSPTPLVLLAACVFFAGIVDALAGGGGLITLPAYLAVGLNPAFVLGTNKLVSSIGTAFATALYHRALRFSIKEFLPILALAGVGAWCGAKGALLLDPTWLRPFLLCILPVAAWFIWSQKNFGREDLSHHLHPLERQHRGMLVAGTIGAYDGFFGPGAGTFYALGFVRFCHHDLLGATARAKALNLLSNVFALAAFVGAGPVQWRLGASLAVLSVCGNWVGSHLGVRQGAKAIRPVVAVMCIGLCAKILFDYLR